MQLHALNALYIYYNYIHIPIMLFFFGIMKFIQYMEGEWEILCQRNKKYKVNKYSELIYASTFLIALRAFLILESILFLSLYPCADWYLLFHSLNFLHLSFWRSHKFHSVTIFLILSFLSIYLLFLHIVCNLDFIHFLSVIKSLQYSFFCISFSLFCWIHIFSSLFIPDPLVWSHIIKK